MNKFATFSRWQKAFYAGPQDLGLVLPRRRGYQSPTLTGGAWCYALIHRHFTLAGRYLFMAFCLLLPFGMLSLMLPIHLLAFALAGIFGVNFLLGFFFRPQCRVIRQLPAQVTAGVEFRVDYVAVASGSRPIFDLRLDTLPLPHHVTLCGGRAFIPFLAKGGGNVSGQAHFRAERRGRYILPALRADSAFPFHLWCWGVTDPGGPKPLLVYPAFTPLQRLRFPRNRPLILGEEGWSAGMGSTQEFVGCREFRDGDPLRRLHWRSWARVGYPVVKEFKDFYQFRALIVLDTWVPRSRFFGHRFWGRHRDNPEFEAAVALTAAMGNYLQHQGASLEVAAPLENGQPGRTGIAGNIDSVMEFLAGLEPRPQDYLAEAHGALLRHSEITGGVWLLLLRWNDARRQLLEDLQRRNISVSTLLITARPEVLPDLPAEVRVLRGADVLAGKCREL